MSKPSDANVKKLMGMGYTKSKASKALKECRNNVQSATSLLVQWQREHEEKEAKAELMAMRKLEAEQAALEQEKVAKERQEAEVVEWAVSAEATEKNKNKVIPKGTRLADMHPRGGLSINHTVAAQNKKLRQQFHPCIAKYGSCKFGETCMFRDVPADVCTNYVMGSCIYGDGCRGSHMVEGVDARDYFERRQSAIMMATAASAGMQGGYLHQEVLMPTPDGSGQMLVAPGGRADAKLYVGEVVDVVPQEAQAQAYVFNDRAVVPEASAWNGMASSHPTYSDPMAPTMMTSPPGRHPHSSTGAYAQAQAQMRAEALHAQQYPGMQSNWHHHGQEGFSEAEVSEVAQNAWNQQHEKQKRAKSKQQAKAATAQGGAGNEWSVVAMEFPEGEGYDEEEECYDEEEEEEEEGGAAPMPFLEKARKNRNGSQGANYRPLDNSGKQPSTRSVTVNKKGEVVPAGGGTATPAAPTFRNQKKHPCIVQHGGCHFGDYCHHADLPGDVCVHWLNGECRYGDGCRYRHEVPAPDPDVPEKPAGPSYPPPPAAPSYTFSSSSNNNSLSGQSSPVTRDAGGKSPTYDAHMMGVAPPRPPGIPRSNQPVYDDRVFQPATTSVVAGTQLSDAEYERRKYWEADNDAELEDEFLNPQSVKAAVDDALFEVDEEKGGVAFKSGVVADGDTPWATSPKQEGASGSATFTTGTAPEPTEGARPRGNQITPKKKKGVASDAASDVGSNQCGGFWGSSAEAASYRVATGAGAAPPKAGALDTPALPGVGGNNISSPGMAPVGRTTNRSPQTLPTFTPSTSSNAQQNSERISSPTTMIDLATRSQETDTAEEKERKAFNAMREAFPQTAPVTLLHCLRLADYDRHKVGEFLLQRENSSSEQIESAFLTMILEQQQSPGKRQPYQSSTTANGITARETYFAPDEEEEETNPYTRSSANSRHRNDPTAPAPGSPQGSQQPGAAAAAAKTKKKQAKLSAAQAAKESMRTVTFLTLTSLFPHVDTNSVEAVLKRTNYDFSESFSIVQLSPENLIAGDLKNEWGAPGKWIDQSNHQKNNKKKVGSSGSPSSPSLEELLVAGAEKKNMKDSPTSTSPPSAVFQGAGSSAQLELVALNGAEKMQVDKLCEQFSELPRVLVRQCFAVDCHKSVDLAAKILMEIHCDTFGSPPAGSNDHGTAAAKKPKGKGPQPPRSHTPPPTATAGGGGVGFVDGDLYRTVADELHAHSDWRRTREEAYLINDARLQLLGMASNAYSRGDGKSAKMLSKRATELSGQYKKLNMLAMQSLEMEQTGNTERKVTSLDLHGFHVSEALDVLARRVKLCLQKRIPRLCVMIGKGLHSRDGVSKIFPAILDAVEGGKNSNNTTSINLSRCTTVKSKSDAQITLRIMLDQTWK